MKIKVGVGMAGVCHAVAAIALGQDASSASEAAKSPPRAKASAAAAAAPAESGMTLAEAQQVLAKERKYVAHPAPGEQRTKARAARPDFEMATPPPAPRTETKPVAPEAGLVWVPGHYMPVKGEWRWVRGEWAVPATPSSVWVAASYDAKEKKWSPGYWQPDRPYASDADLTVKDGAASPNY